MIISGDPLHRTPPAGTWWTTNNLREAIPGVPTALTWSVWERGSVLGTAGMIERLGLGTPEEARVLGPRGISIIYGRPAVSLEHSLSVMSRMPGVDPEVFVQAIFGAGREGIGYEPLPPLSAEEAERVGATAMATIASHVADLRRRAEYTRQEWSRLLAEPSSPDSALELLRTGVEIYNAVYEDHLVMTSLASAVYGELAALAARAGLPGHERRLATGHGGMEEIHLARDLRDLAADELSIGEFLDRHGYHGPNEGEISSPSWRERSELILAIVRGYRASDDDPLARVQRQSILREEAEQQILDALPTAEHDAARALFDRAREWIPAREIGKAGFLQGLDIVRAAARTLGASLAEKGLLDHPDHVFHFTLEELPEAARTGAREIAREREAQRADYLTTDVPPLFEGLPARIPLEETGAGREAGPVEITGVPVSSGKVTGTARVILDPLDAEPVQPGEILVCETTDPSWVSLFMDAAALVIDIGQTMSHGAIIARELGIPCVIDTKQGTRWIADGATIEVDGDLGTARVLETPGAAGA